MSSISKTDNDLHLHLPAYYALDDTNIHHDKKDSLVSRIFYIALPFIALHKPFGRLITFVMDSIRSISSFGQLADKKKCKELAKTAIAISALVGTYFMHPLGLCSSTLYDLGYDVTSVIASLQMGHTNEAIYAMLSMGQHLCYLGTMLIGSLEVVAVSILLSMVIEFCRSKKEYLKGNLLEACAHLLMSAVRFSQAAPYIEKIAYKNDIKGKEISRSLTEVLEKIRNHAVCFFYLSARYLISPMWKSTEMWLNTVSLYNNNQSSITQKILSVTKSTFSSLALLPFTFAGIALGHIFHFSAFLLSPNSYIHLKGNSKEKESSDKEFTFSQMNCCLTPGGFAKMFGGLDLSDDQRLEKIIAMIHENNPDLFCGQEVSDIKQAYALYNALSSEYSDFILGAGMTPFILQNNSGLFVASKEPILNPKFHDFSDIEGTESMVNKGYLSFSNSIGNFINTHLSPSSDDLNPTDAEINTREIEAQRLCLESEKKSSSNNKPTYVMGDFNINRNSPEYHNNSLFTKGEDQYKNRQGVTAETDYLKKRNWHHEENAKSDGLFLDYVIAFYKNLQNRINTHICPTFNIEHPEQAISDHAMVNTTITMES